MTTAALLKHIISVLDIVYLCNAAFLIIAMGINSLILKQVKKGYENKVFPTARRQKQMALWGFMYSCLLLTMLPFISIIHAVAQWILTGEQSELNWALIFLLMFLYFLDKRFIPGLLRIRYRKPFDHSKPIIYLNAISLKDALKDNTSRYNGALIRRCDDCGKKIVIEQEDQESVAKDGVRIVCDHCAAFILTIVNTRKTNQSKI